MVRVKGNLTHPEETREQHHVRNREHEAIFACRHAVAEATEGDTGQAEVDGPVALPGVVPGAEGCRNVPQPEHLPPPPPSHLLFTHCRLLSAAIR